MIRTTIFLVCAALSLNAQKHDYNWIMGYEEPGFPDPRWGGLIMDFNTTPYSFHKVTSNMNFQGTGAACSDSSGNLLFYTNGIRIHNKLHQIMENGDTINPGSQWKEFNSQQRGYSVSYGAICLPVPEKTNLYYLIHLGSILNLSPPVAALTPLYYSLIDMNANGGLGKVIEKNIILSTDSLVIPVAVKHGNGRDWWVITGIETTSIQYVFLITPEGIQGPQVYDFGPVPGWPPEGGLCFISPDGASYIRSQMYDGIRIYDFNRCTGEMGNLRFIPKTTTLTGGIFSADSRMVYFQTSRFISQIDLPALDTAAYMDTIAHYDRSADEAPPFYTVLGYPQLGPDGKIYMNNLTSTFKMHVIHRPELPGGACDIQLNGIELPRLNNTTTYNLPNYRLGEWEDSPCDTINLQQTDDGFLRTWYDPERWQPEKQQERRVIHLFPESAVPVSPEEWLRDPALLFNQELRVSQPRLRPPQVEEATNKLDQHKKALKHE